MHFLIKLTENSNSTFKILKEYDADVFTELNCLQISDTGYFSFNKNGESIYIIGDLVSDHSPPQLQDDLILAIKNNTVFTYGGFFYAISISLVKNHIKVFSSAFNILPIYYTQIEGQTIISSSLKKLLNVSQLKTEVDKQFILERIFFNYSLFNRTVCKQVKLLASGSHLEFDGKLKVKKSFNIESYFVSSPQKSNKVLKELSKLFINSAKKYFPYEKFGISFTSGFDGRTLVAVASYLNKNFFTYSFGTEGFNDITIPMSQANELELEFEPIFLDKDYVYNHSYQCGCDFINKNDGNASFARAHYRYAAEKLAIKASYIITGNFGSELFRAFNYSGSVLSEELKKFFACEEINCCIKEMNCSEKWKYLIRDNYKIEFQNLLDELSDFKKKYISLSKNAFLYIYLFEEVFRKYFGAEINMQRHFVVNRCPFLDFNFVKELLKTYYAGVYSKFYTNNPISRFKGQLPYAIIINDTNPLISNMVTGKGYKPRDLISPAGKIALIKNKFLRGNTFQSDPYAVVKSFNHNLDKYKVLKLDDSLFNTKEIKKDMNVDLKMIARPLLSHILSLNIYLTEIQA